MTIISDDPIWRPVIDSYNFSSYFVVSALVGIMYDWALTFGQEVELVWRQRWSLMTVLYLSVRYLGVSFAILATLSVVPTISMTDTGCYIMAVVFDWTGFVIFIMLWVIIITRLYAMYQRSRNILIFLIVTFLAMNIFDAVVTVMTTVDGSGEELILSGTYQCSIGTGEDGLILHAISWIVGCVWEVVALCLATRIAVKHFRELRRHPAGGIMEDCFMVLIKAHMLYCASSITVYCFNAILYFTPAPSVDEISLDSQIYSGLVQVLTILQMVVLGPRLILSIREYHAKLVADSDAATGMTSIAFQERVHISTGNGV